MKCLQQLLDLDLELLQVEMLLVGEECQPFNDAKSTTRTLSHLLHKVGYGHSLENMVQSAVDILTIIEGICPFIG